MRLHLDLQTGISPDKIGHQQQVLLIGSCFTEHIGQRLNDLKFDCHSNPFGIVFNPLSMIKTMDRLMENKAFTDKDVMEHDGSWLSLEVHSSLSKPSQESLLRHLNAEVEQWHRHLKEADWLILTFGSAYYYEYLANGTTVANCHKLPAGFFTKKMAHAGELTSAYHELLQKLQAFNPSLKVIVTVSPVKHLRDGVIQNNLSKSVLSLTAHGLAERQNNCSYFPSYELVNDDLRDYRFYEADMAHPNKQAIDYVWNKFCGTYFGAETQALLDRIAALNTAFLHRPLQAESKAFAEFKAAQLKKCSELKVRYPYLDLEKEQHYFSQ